MAKSKKIEIFEALFDARYDHVTGTLTDSFVTGDQIVDAIKARGSTLSPRNPPNFLKDFIRKESGNLNWPPSISAKGYTARQHYGETGLGYVFEFIPYKPDQTIPFPDLYPTDSIIENLHLIESVSLPSAARAMGRPDEAWLIQACVHQRVVETHFALFSPLEVVDIFHLQNSVKMTPEIDAIFLISFKVEGAIKKAIVTFEAKRNELILPNQIKAQIVKLGSDCAKNVDLQDIEYIVGMACKSMRHDKKRVILLFEMEPVAVAVAKTFAGKSEEMELSLAKRAAYQFKPQIRGI